LQNLRRPEDVAKSRGLRIKDVLPVRKQEEEPAAEPEAEAAALTEAAAPEAGAPEAAAPAETEEPEAAVREEPAEAVETKQRSTKKS
jgi:hypothetical protein